MRYPSIVHHGATTGVTGSCHQLQMVDEHALLIDCGLFQGAETSSAGRAGAGSLAPDFSLDGKALVATHAHVGRVGRIAYLLQSGFKGSIFCGESPARLLPIVLEGAFKLGSSRDRKHIGRDLKLTELRIVALPYKQLFNLIDTQQLSARVRLQRAGHILGSACVEVNLQYSEMGGEKRIVFSCDLGAPHAPILPAPQAPDKADILVIESTYCDHLHEDLRSRRARLEQVLEHALSNQGTALIPALTIGRTQERLYELGGIIHRRALKESAKTQLGASRPKTSKAQAPDWASLPIILDSPLASRFTSVYRELDRFWDAEARSRLAKGRNPLAFRNLLKVDSHQAQLYMVNRLAQAAQPAIVIAGNVMCSSGRIVNYLKAMLSDERHDVLFVGYQAEGTPGRQIQRFGPRSGYVGFDGQLYDIRAQVHTIGGYPAHADLKGLVSFVTRTRRWPSKVRVVHGEPGAKAQLAECFRKYYQAQGQFVSIVVPE